MNTHHDGDEVRAAFDRLQRDSETVDTMAALRKHDTNTRPRRLGAGLLTAAAALIVVVISVAVWGARSDDDGLDVASGQSEEPAGTASDPAAGSPVLDTTSWLLTAGTGPDGEVPIVDGWPITLTFAGDTLGGTAACNSFGGSYRLDGTTFSIDDLGQTEMACVGDGADVMQSEDRFMAALRAVDRLGIDGDELTLTGPSSELVFTLETPVPAADLVGQLWLLDTIIDGDTASTVTGDPATVLLRPDGTVQGSTGCRQFSGQFVISGSSVTFTSFAMSGECNPGIEEQDSHVVTVLGDGFAVDIDGDRLWLSSQGNLGLGYVAIDEPPELAPIPAVTLDDLDGTTWHLVEGSGPQGEILPGGAGITLGFNGQFYEGDTGCNTYRARPRLDGSSFSSGPIDTGAEICAGVGEVEYLAGLQDVNRIALFGALPADRELVLSGPSTDMLFRLVSDPSSPEPMSLDELLDDQRRDPVLVEGRLLYRGGSWILCDEIDVEVTPTCAGRWVVVNNYDAVVNPHTEPPTSIADAAFGLAEVNPEFVAKDDAVYTPLPRQLLIRLVDDSRAVIPAWPSGAEGSESDSELLGAFLSFGAGASVDTRPLMLSDAVVLGLSDQVIVTRTADELADPAAWQLEAESFRGRVGPFSALDLLGTAFQGTYVVGRHGHCAAPPAPIPAGLQDARQLSFQPIGIDSCIAWWTVDLFVDAEGRVIGITLDLWEP